MLDREEVFRELLPHILRQLHQGAMSVKQHAATLLAHHFRESSGGRQIGELYRVMITDFYAGQSCWQRMGFLLFCKACLDALDTR